MADHLASAAAASNPEDHHNPKKEGKSPNPLEKAKQDFESFFHHKSPRHHKETHGLNDDIDDNTPVNEVKAPNVFERVKEEVEAIVEAVHQKKDSKDHK